MSGYYRKRFPVPTVDKDRNDQGTTAILLPDGFLVSGKFRGRNMLNFCPSLSRKCALTFWLRGHV